jgi:flagellar protein FliS
MTNTSFAYNNRASQVNPYLMKEILEASPQKLLIKIYDFAIMNCQKGDMVKTNKALSELINSLNFQDESCREISLGLLKLYKFCQEEMRKKNYEIVHKILSELRETWLKIFNM